MKYEAIRFNSQEFSVRKMCKVLNLAESAYYQWLRRKEAREERDQNERKLSEFIRTIFDENWQSYGYRRMHLAYLAKYAELVKSKDPVPKYLDETISEYKIRRIMQQNGMYPVSSMKFKPFKKGKSTGRYFENVVNQEFNAKNPNEIWAGDITYIKTVLGYVYLAVVIDLYNREIIGYSVSKNIDVELVKRALSNSLIKKGGDNGNTVFHSDRGSQYSSKSYQSMLSENNLTGSMSKSGCPYDNACVESFFSAAKRECIYRKEYVTLEEVKKDLFEYIELFYNRKRMHGSLGYMSPVEYRLANVA